MIYKLTKNRMPDENSNPLWSTQISQDNQPEMNQSWDDFVFDFWDWELEDVKNTDEIDTQDIDAENELEKPNSDSEWLSLDFNQNNSSDNKEWDNSEEEVNIQDLDKEENNVDNDFDISLNKNDVSENEEMEISMEDDNVELDTEKLIDDESINENVSEDTNNQEMTESDWQPENDFVISLDEDTGTIMDEEINREEKIDDKSTNQESSLSLNIENNDITEDEYWTDKNGVEINDINLWETNNMVEEHNIQEENMNIVNEKSSEVWDENQEFNSYNENVSDDFMQEDTSKIAEMFEEDSIRENQEILTSEENQDENLDFVTDYNPEELHQNGGDSESIEQSNENHDVILENEVSELWGNADSDTGNVIGDSNVLSEQDKISDEDYAYNSSQIWVESEMESSVVENPSNVETVHDSLSKNNNTEWVVNTVENVINLENTNNSEINTVENVNVEEINNIEPQDNPITNNVEEPKMETTNEINNENINKSENQEVLSTLSLDQILDSELTNNLQSIDNENPVKIANNIWILSNKKVTIIVGFWLFVLIWLVAVLAFPSKSSERQEWEVVQQTWTITEIEEPTTHSAAPEDPLENPGTATGSVAWSDVEFPEPDWGDPKEDPQTNPKEDPLEDPEPYVCNDDSCLEEPEEPIEIEDTLTLGDIMPTISEFRSQAEKYSAQWYNLKDKQLIKYAIQAIHLCDAYQNQIEWWEWLDQESFDTYKTKIKSLISKIEKYVGIDDDVQTFVQSDFDEEYGHEWKQEYLDYIYERDSSSF